MAAQFKLQLTVAITLVRVLERNPRSPVPDDDFARAILSGRDLAFKTVVGNRMVFNVNRHAFVIRIEARSFRHGPALHGSVEFKPEVVMQTGGPVLLDNK